MTEPNVWLVLNPESSLVKGLENNIMDAKYSPWAFPWFFSSHIFQQLDSLPYAVFGIFLALCVIFVSALVGTVALRRK